MLNIQIYIYKFRQCDIIMIWKQTLFSFLLYSAVSSPLDRSKRFTLILPWQTCSFRHQLGFSWKHSSHAAIAQRLLIHMSTTVYSQVLIYTAESTEAPWSERECPNFETVAKVDSNPGSLACESGILPLSYRAPLCIFFGNLILSQDKAL